MKILFNHTHLAVLLNNTQDHDQIFDIDLEKSFFTPYGMFLPLYASGIHFVRALRRAMPMSSLRKVYINSRVLHINHLGEVWLLAVYTPGNDITWEQITTANWVVSGFRGSPKDNSIAYGHLLKGCKTLESAAKRLDHLAYDGFYRPTLFEVSTISQRLTELGYTRPFFHTEFIDLF